MYRVDRDGGNKTQRIYKCHFSNALSKLIVDNGLEGLWRREKPDSSEFTRCDRSSGTRSRIDRIYTDIKIASNAKINHVMVSFTNHYNSTSIDRLKLEKIRGTLITLFYGSPSLSQLQRICLFIKNKKKQPLFSKRLVGICQILF